MVTGPEEAVHERRSHGLIGRNFQLNSSTTTVVVVAVVVVAVAGRTTVMVVVVGPVQGP